mgnify:FL=1
MLASWKEFGQVQTIAISPSLVVLDGHQRLNVLLAAHGADYQVDARQASRELSEDEQKRLVITLHAGAVGSWDWDSLSGWDAPDLMDWGMSADTLADWKRDVAALNNLIESEKPEPVDAEPQVDRAAELLEKWGVKPGDLWRIGDHRLLCGDSTKREDVERVMVGEKADYLFTDPPYGIDYDPQYLADIAARHNKKLSSTNKVIGDDGSLDLSFLFEYKKRMIWGFPYIYDADATGWIVWDKQPGVERRGIVTPIEMASTTMRNGFDMIRVMWVGFYRAAGEDKQPHPTQKPLGVYSPFIESWTNPEEIIFDPFCGSGAVVVVCQNLNRRCRAIEISPAYCSVILERMNTAFSELEIERITS